MCTYFKRKFNSGKLGSNQFGKYKCWINGILKVPKSRSVASPQNQQILKTSEIQKELIRRSFWKIGNTLKCGLWKENSSDAVKEETRENNINTAMQKNPQTTELINDQNLECCKIQGTTDHRNETRKTVKPKLKIREPGNQGMPALGKTGMLKMEAQDLGNKNINH